MSEAADPFCRELEGYLTEQLGWDVVLVNEIPCRERLARLRDGDLDAGWICGVDYVKLTSFACSTSAYLAHDTPIELMAAPVMLGQRYQGKPVYFSDVIVQYDSPFWAFEDLRGARWAYNEPGSFSGYLVMLHRLAQMGEGANYFGEIIESGAHTASIRMILDGQADVAVIDSTAFDHYFAWEPEVRARFRVIECLGPNPVPPWVASCSLAGGERDALKEVFLGMYDNPRGRAILSNGLFDRFVPVEDSDYDPIRRVISSSQGKSIRT